MAAKLTRKQIQQDSVRSVLVDVYDWLTERAVTLGIVGGSILLLVVVVYGVQTYQGSVEADLQARYAEAFEIFQSPVQGEETTDLNQPVEGRTTYPSREERDQAALDAFSTLAETNPDNKVGLFARYYQAVLYHRLGRTQESVTTLQSLIKDAGESEVRHLARNLLATLHLNQDQFDEAIALLEEILEAEKSDFPRDRLLVQLARAAEAAGHDQVALDYYQKLTTEFPNAPESREAQSHIDFLEAKLTPSEPEQETPSEATSGE